jgi:hypothetical protein
MPQINIIKIKGYGNVQIENDKIVVTGLEPQYKIDDNIIYITITHEFSTNKYSDLCTTTLTIPYEGRIYHIEAENNTVLVINNINVHPKGISIRTKKINSCRFSYKMGASQMVLVLDYNSDIFLKFTDTPI